MKNFYGIIAGSVIFSGGVYSILFLDAAFSPFLLLLGAVLIFMRGS